MFGISNERTLIYKYISDLYFKRFDNIVIHLIFAFLLLGESILQWGTFTYVQRNLFELIPDTLQGIGSTWSNKQNKEEHYNYYNYFDDNSSSL